MRTLADKLDDIALGNTFDSEALYNARAHPAITVNDRLMLLRMSYSMSLSTDQYDLQQIASYIREWEQTNANK